MDSTIPPSLFPTLKPRCAISISKTFASLLPEWPESLLPTISARLAAHPTKVVVLAALLEAVQKLSGS